ncbi:MAG: type I-E CRISPR-associated protein Cas5/CasD [Desulfomonilia bacterium]|jgi:CRISPR system Cascade subunit CasD
MSSDRRYLALSFEGPIQSWGFDSQYNRRNTGLMPTKSAIAGMCCAALGYSRGSREEHVFLEKFGAIKMIAIAIPRKVGKKDLKVQRMQDFHTVQNTKRASGSLNADCVLTNRQYLTDASFGVLLEGNADFLREIASALADPKWGIWLGRKTCIPSAPVLAGLKDNFDNLTGLVEEKRKDALTLLIGDKPLEYFTYQEEAEAFIDGIDTINDTPVSFASEQRLFSPRRVRTVHGKAKG